MQLAREIPVARDDDTFETQPCGERSQFVAQRACHVRIRCPWLAMGAYDPQDSSRAIRLEVDDATLAARREQMAARGKDAFRPIGRDRVVSPALRAYAVMATSAHMGAVRDVGLVGG